MTIVKRNGLFPSIFHNFFENEWEKGTGLTKEFVNQPAVNIKETEKEFQIELATPGIKKEDIKIQVEHDVLEISALTSVKKEEKSKSGDYKRREFYSTSFKQTFGLSDQISVQDIEAKYEDGVLRVVLPKLATESRKVVQNIEIK